MHSAQNLSDIELSHRLGSTSDANIIAPVDLIDRCDKLALFCVVTLAALQGRFCFMCHTPPHTVLLVITFGWLCNHS